MYTFPDLIKKIRHEVGLTQSEFANVLGVSVVLISMVETGQKGVSKGVSKKLIECIAKALQVRPSSVTPFLFTEENNGKEKLSGIELELIQWGERMQDHLIKKRSKLLREHAEKIPKTIHTKQKRAR